MVLFPAALCIIVNLPEHRNVIPSWGKLGGTGEPEPLRTGIGSDLEQQQSDLGASACEVMDLRGRLVYGSEGTSEGRGHPSIGERKVDLPQGSKTAPSRTFLGDRPRSRRSSSGSGLT